MVTKNTIKTTIKEFPIPYNNIKLFDIAANLCDDKFKGEYNGKKYHENDTNQVLERSHKIGVNKLLLSAGCIEDSHDSFNLSKLSKDYYITIGTHPCRALDIQKQIDKDSKYKGSFDSYYKYMLDLFTEYKDKVVAVGECGLDYDRFHYSPKEDQLKHFPIHFDIAQKTNLPMYLHNRNTNGDFIKLVKENRHKFSTGVVHSFTDDLNELKACLDLGLYIGVNGCSLKTKENIEVVKEIPLDRIMLETDAPYCDIKNTHASKEYVKTEFNRIKKEKVKIGDMCKDRNEPCMIV